MHNSTKKNKIFRNKLSQGSTHWKLKKTDRTKKTDTIKKKDLYNENYKTLLKQLKKTQINGNTCHVNGLKDLIYVIITQSDLQIQRNPYQNPNDFFAEIGNTFQKFIGNIKKQPKQYWKGRNWKSYWLTSNFPQSYNNQDSIVLA